MWNDGPLELQNIYREFDSPGGGGNAPFECPVCHDRKAHIYMNLANEKTRRGGLWIWCSGCRCFMHSTAYVPEYWVNCPAVEFGRLAAIPDYLEEMRDIIDGHVNAVIDERRRGKYFKDFPGSL